MRNILWLHSLNVCYALLKLLKNDKEFSNERLIITNSNITINDISDENLESLLEQTPALHATTTILIDADHTTETGEIHTKFVMHYSERLKHPQLLIINANRDPETITETHLLKANDPFAIATSAYFEQMIANYNE